MQALDRLHVPIAAMSKIHTRDELVPLVQWVQLIHIAHVYSAGDLMNRLYPAFATVPKQRTPDCT